MKNEWNFFSFCFLILFFFLLFLGVIVLFLLFFSFIRFHIFFSNGLFFFLFFFFVNLGINHRTDPFLFHIVCWLVLMSARAYIIGEQSAQAREIVSPDGEAFVQAMCTNSHVSAFLSAAGNVFVSGQRTNPITNLIPVHFPETVIRVCFFFSHEFVFSVTFFFFLFDRLLLEESLLLL